MHFVASLSTIALATLLPATGAHNFWVARCETQDLVNGINSQSVEFHEVYNFVDADWYGAGTVCLKNDYRPWTRWCIEGRFNSGWSYGPVELSYFAKSDTIEWFPENAYFGTMAVGGQARGCCKKTNRQWTKKALFRNKVCKSMFYCGDGNGGCYVDQSLIN